MAESNGVYRTSPLKRARRTNAEMGALACHLSTLIEQHQPVTVRQAFYLAVSAGVLPKTEQAYKNTLVELLGKLRRNGLLPWHWIADNTRWMRKPHTHDDLETALAETARLYRRNLWRQQSAYVEIWLEKDALAGVLYPVTAQWDVPLMVTRGYASLTYLYDAAQALAAQGKPAHIYYFGDHDPSGRDIPRKVEADLRGFAPDVDITFLRVAVEPWQITAWQLPTRPTKKTDSRAKGFVGESVEVDAIPPDTLRMMVATVIEQHVDEAALEVTRAAEHSERTILTRLAARHREETEGG